MVTGKFLFSTLMLCFFVLFHSEMIAQKADFVLTNGKIFTADSAQLYVQALAVNGNKILAIGSNEQIMKFISSKTRTIDLKGKTVVPGFNDAHDHLGWLIPSEKGYLTEFSATGPSRAAIIDSLGRLLKKAKPGEWIHGTIGLTAFNDTGFRRRVLDSIAPENPLALYIVWGHGMIVNTKALNAINVAENAVDPLGGWYERSANTHTLTGALFEGAQFPVWEAIAVSEPANLVNALRSHAWQQLQYGITTVQNMSSTLQGNAARTYFNKANLPIRLRLIAMPGNGSIEKGLLQLQSKDKLSSSLAYISGVKYVIDGTSMEQTALKTKPYPNRPGYYGRLNFLIDSILKILQEGLNSYNQLMLHITGDSATKVVLQLMKQMATPETWSKKRVRIEHGNGIVNEAMAKDVKALGIVIVHTPQYGMKNSIRSWLNRGIHVGIGPDALINPFLNIMMLATQQLDKSENISREQAVIAYTHTNAYAEFAEKRKGTLTPGKLADLAVLSLDIFSIPAEQLPQTISLMTMVDGKIKLDKLE